MSNDSLLQVNHYAQQVVSNLFQAYDWGSKAKNREHYGQPSPPIYDLKNLTVPTALFHGTTVSYQIGNFFNLTGYI